MNHDTNTTTTAFSNGLLEFMMEGRLLISGTDTHYWLHEKRNLAKVANHYSAEEVYPAAHEEIVVRLPFWWCFSTPSLILNAEKLREIGLYFDETLNVCSDWWFFWRAAQSGRVGNLAAKLVSYRHHVASHGPSSKDQIAIEVDLIRRRILNEVKLDQILGEDGLAAFLAFRVEAERITAPLALGQRKLLFERLIHFDGRAAGFEREAWERVLHEYLGRAVPTKTCRQSILEKWPLMRKLISAK